MALAMILVLAQFSAAATADTNIAGTAPRVAGATTVVHSTGKNDVRWILPGLRALDPKIFGTPAAPLGFEPDVGVPIGARLTNGAGTAWTTTAGPTPFSNNWGSITGEYKLTAKDKTLFDDPDSQDAISYQASFTSPDGGISYEVETSRIIPVGPDHPFMGGVGTNFVHHGMTGIGTKLMPTAPTFVAFWGIATLRVNGAEVANNRLIHLMTTCRVRDENYNLVFDDGVDCTKMHTHMMLPNVEITPGGPVESPVPTGFFLPNGMQQPFLHIMFEDIKVTGVNTD
jgi:hypothetical protein